MLQDRRCADAARQIYAAHAPEWDRRWRLILVFGQLAQKERDALRRARTVAEPPGITVYLSPQGRPLTQDGVRKLATEPRLILLAGRMAIPAEQYEAASVDGASNWQKFRYITWPLMILPVIFTITSACSRP